MGFVYLACLLFSLTGLALADWRYKLALFYDARRTVKVIGAGMILFLVWDVLGIVSGIFFTGESRYDIGLLILPELPIEEVFFLLLLNYFTLLIWRAVQK